MLFIIFLCFLNMGVSLYRNPLYPYRPAGYTPRYFLNNPMGQFTNFPGQLGVNPHLASQTPTPNNVPSSRQLPADIPVRPEARSQDPLTKFLAPEEGFTQAKSSNLCAITKRSVTTADITNGGRTHAEHFVLCSIPEVISAIESVEQIDILKLVEIVQLSPDFREVIRIAVICNVIIKKLSLLAAPLDNIFFKLNSDGSWKSNGNLWRAYKEITNALIVSN